MRSHQLTKLFNFFFFTLATLMLLWSGHNLFFVTYIPSISIPTPPVGHIENTLNTVKLKKVNLFSWNDAHKNFGLNEGDLIFTFKNAESDINLGQGKSIHIFSESLVEVLQEDQLKLNKGRAKLVITNRNSILNIKIGNTHYQIKSDQADIELNKKGDSSEITVKAGTITVESATQSIKLEKDQRLTITHQEVQITDTSLEAISPDRQSFIADDPFHLVKFQTKIQNLNNAEEAFIQISRDENFQAIIAEFQVSDENQYNLNRGEYYWRLKAGKKFSTMAKFTVLQKVPAPILMHPADGLEVSTFQKEVLYNLRWENTASSIYELMILDENENVIVDEIIEGTSYQWRATNPGRVSWKVRAIENFISSTWSESRKLITDFLEFAENEPIVLEISRPDQKVDFKWEQESKAHSYQFILAKDKEFKEIIIQKKIYSNQTAFSIPHVGSYYWSAIAKTKAGNTKYTRPVRVIIRPTPPPQKPSQLPELKIKLDMKKHTTSFFNIFLSNAYAENLGMAKLTWPKVNDAKIYEISIYSDPELKHRIKLIKTSKNYYHWDVARGGKYYWNFRYQDYWGRFSPLSDASALIIETSLENLPKKTTSQKVIVTTEVKSKKIVPPPVNEFLFGYLPGQIDYTQKSDSQNFKINGTSLAGLRFVYQRSLSSQHHLSLQLSNQSGSVYENEVFAYRLLDLHYQYNIDHWQIGGELSTGQISLYHEENEQAVFLKNESFFNLKLSVNYKFLLENQQQFLAGLRIPVYYTNGYIFDLTYYFYGFFNHFWIIKFSLENTGNKFTDNDVNIEQYQVFIGPSIRW